MKELAKNQHLPLLERHIFQFDFLNDCFFDKPCEKHKDKLDSTCRNCQNSKLPKKLQEILKDKEKRKKLIIFINPPYAEAASTKTITQTTNNKINVSNQTFVSEQYGKKYKKSTRELFVQFFIRTYLEIPHCILASFSTLKYLNASNFIEFRELFKAEFKGGFIVPADTFDNVKGQFPIGFLVWDLSKNGKQ